MRKAAILLIIIGILTALYPQANRAYFFYRQARILNSWEETSPAETPLPLAEGQSKRPEESTAEDNYSPLLEPDLIALLIIDKIDLKIPVFMGATQANLRKGAGLLAEGSLLGETGNAVITAHRSHSFGMQFNRLNEVEVDDEIFVKTRYGQYRYVVYAVQVLKPAEITMLAGQGERLLTLVTCHPLYSRDPPYRLIVQASIHEEVGEG